MKYSWSGQMSGNRPLKVEESYKKVQFIGSQVDSAQQSQLPHNNKYHLKSSYNPSKDHYSFKKETQLNRKSTNTVSDVSGLNENYYQEMEQSLKLQNSNLNEHNSFLITQIKTLFERQKKYKKALLISREKIKKLEGLNQHLQSQLMMLTSSIVGEIERMQRLIQSERSILYEDMNSPTSDMRKSLEAIGSETEIALSHNLEALKQRVNNICNENLSRATTQCQHSGNFQSFSLDSKISSEVGKEGQLAAQTQAIFDRFNHHSKIKSKQNQFESSLTSNGKKQAAQNKRSSIKKI